MSNDKIQLLSPLFLKYQADFEKNPRSRVFAPLAEIYRKLGMTDKAMEILSQGIRFHPTYTMGYLGLAFCYHDVKQYSLAYSTLMPLVETNRDNIRLQKLFADICLLMGYKEEALSTFKYLLFINPRDKEVALQVVTLERSLEDQYKPTHNPIYIPESEFRSDKKNEDSSEQLFDVDKLGNRPKSSDSDFDDWMALDLSRDQKPVTSSDPYEFWNVKKGDLKLPKENLELEFTNTDAKEIHYDFDLDSFNNEQENDQEDEKEDEHDDEQDSQEDLPETEAPLVTHTLVDLYCGQGHIEKALEVLEKILILNPKDQKTIRKISEIKALMGPYEEASDEEIIQEENSHTNIASYMDAFTDSSESSQKPHLEILQDVSEEDGRKNLMSIFDQQIRHVEVEDVQEKKSSKPLQLITSKKGDKNRIIEEKLTQFLKKIQKRALDYQARV